MSKRTLRVYSSERDNEYVRKVTVWSDRGLSGTRSDYFKIKVGTSDTSGNLEFFGEWDMSRMHLSAGQSLVLTGVGDLNWPMFDGDAAVIEVEKVGTPDLISGLVVEWKFHRVGSIQEQAIQRTEANQPPAREVSRPMFSSAGVFADSRTQSAFDELYTSLNDSGITEWGSTIVIPNLF